MAQRIYRRPNRTPRRLPEGDNTGFRPEPSFKSGPEYTPGLRPTAGTGGADDMLSSIDNELDREGNTAGRARSSISESDARAAKNRRIQQAEIQAARNNPANRTVKNLAKQEEAVKMPSSDDLYKRAKEGRQRSGKRGIFIGVGAGGGLISIIAGFALTLPFKLPGGIMDSITNRAAARLERVGEKRGEKFLLQYALRGSAAAVGGSDFIATGNPLGDAFANLRTTNFEKGLKESYGLKFERAANGNIRITHDGTSLGDFKNADQLQEFLNRDDLSSKELRKVVKLVTDDKFSVIRFLKRLKFMKWLRLKYKIPRFGNRKQKAGESNEDYDKAVTRDINEKVETGNMNNLSDFVDCLGSGGDKCNGPDQEKLSDLDKGKGAEDLQRAASEAVADVADEAANEGAVVGKKFTQRVLEKMLGKAGASLVPWLGEVDFAARLDHFIATALEDNLLQKLHGDYMKAAYIVMYATMVGYGDQTKAGDLTSSAAGLIADRYNGMEDSQSFNFIQSGELKGQGLTTMQKIGEDTNYSEWQKLPGQLYGTIGLVPRAPLIAWYYTVSQLIDLGGGLLSDIVTKIPAARSAMEAFGGLISNLLGGLLDLIGMSVDPLDTGSKLHLDTFVGAVASYDDFSKDAGMRQLSHDQAVAVDNDMKREQLADRADQPWFDRLFNLNNSDSLATNLMMRLPSAGLQSPLGNIAFASAGLLNQTPSQLASLTTPGAYAASTAIPEDIGGSLAFGGTLTDLSQPFSAAVIANQPCPTTADGSTFNTCMVDTGIMDSISCSAKGCDGLNTPTGGGDTGTTTPVLSGNAQQLAQQILELNKQGIIIFEPDTPQNPDGALQDIRDTAAGKPTAGCGNGPVTLGPKMLAALVHAASKYKFRINALTSDHHCHDGALHAQGNGADLGLVNGQVIDPDTIRQPATLKLYQDFAIFLSQGMAGGHIGQKQVLGTLPLANGVEQNNDTPNHIHMDVPR